MKHLERLAVALLAPMAAAGDWPQFRGPTGQGVSSAQELPLRWSEEDGVLWKQAVHGRGWSSPVVAGGEIWLTTATEDGRVLSVLAVDAGDGRILHDQALFRVEEPQFAHKFNSYASPTPVADAEHVYVTFGAEGTACIRLSDRRVLWTRTDIRCNHFRGAGSSPILFGGLLIMNYDGSDHQFVTALDKRTGETVWRTRRSIDFQDLGEDGLPIMDGDLRKAFSTPHLARFGGTPALLSIGSKCLYAYDPLSGRELWRVESRVSHSASTRPTVGSGRIYYCTGFPRGEVWCVEPGESPRVLWTLQRSVSNKPSMILHGGMLFLIHDGGVASCVSARDGSVLWQERVGGNYSASPLLHQDRIYFFSEEGKTTVVAAEGEYRELASSRLDGGFMASPAVIGDSLVLRTKTHLYRITGD